MKQPLPFHVIESLQPVARLFVQRREWTRDEINDQGIARAGRMVGELAKRDGWKIETIACTDGSKPKSWRKYVCHEMPEPSPQREPLEQKVYRPPQETHKRVDTVSEPIRQRLNRWLCGHSLEGAK